MCQHGARVVRNKLLGQLPEDSFRMVIVWSKVLENDSFKEAMKQASKFSSDRVIHFWDPDTIVPQAYQKTLGWSSIAWDVYMIYGPGKLKWDELPPSPDRWFYSHQKKEEFPDRHLSADEKGEALRKAIKQLIDQK